MKSGSRTSRLTLYHCTTQPHGRDIDIDVVHITGVKLFAEDILNKKGGCRKEAG